MSLSYTLFIARDLFGLYFTDTIFRSEICNGGSLGHGTVVPGHYDIDLVLYSTGDTH